MESYLQVGLGGLRRHRMWPVARLPCSYLHRILSNGPRRQFSSNIFLLARGGPVSPRTSHIIRSQPPSSYGPPPNRVPNSKPPKKSYFRDTPTIVVGSFIAACVGIWSWHSYLVGEYERKGSSRDPRALEFFDRNFALSLQNLREGRYYTMLTSTFTHYGLGHLALNMMTLWSFGPSILRLYGIPAFATLWVGSGICGGLLQWWSWRNEPPYANKRAIGASGAVLGIITPLTFVSPFLEISMFFIPLPLCVATAGGAVFSVAAIYEGWLPGIGHVAHLGGMAFGAGLWFVALRKGRFRR